MVGCAVYIVLRSVNMGDAQMISMPTGFSMRLSTKHVALRILVNPQLLSLPPRCLALVYHGTFARDKGLPCELLRSKPSHRFSKELTVDVKMCLASGAAWIPLSALPDWRPASAETRSIVERIGF